MQLGSLLFFMLVSSAAAWTPATVPYLYVEALREDPRPLFWLNAPALSTCYKLDYSFSRTLPKYLELVAPTTTGSLVVIYSTPISTSLQTGCVQVVAAPTAAVLGTLATSLASSYFRITQVDAGTVLVESDKFSLPSATMSFAPAVAGATSTALTVIVTLSDKAFHALGDKASIFDVYGGQADCYFETGTATMPVPTKALVPTAILSCTFAMKKGTAPIYAAFIASTKTKPVIMIAPTAAQTAAWKAA